MNDYGGTEVASKYGKETNAGSGTTHTPTPDQGEESSEKKQ